MLRNTEDSFTTKSVCAGTERGNWSNVDKALSPQYSYGIHQIGFRLRSLELILGKRLWGSMFLTAVLLLFASTASAADVPTVRFTFDEDGFGYYQLNDGDHVVLQPLFTAKDSVTNAAAPLEYVLPLAVTGIQKRALSCSTMPRISVAVSMDHVASRSSDHPA
jgi:hypothetical protein